MVSVSVSAEAAGNQNSSPKEPKPTSDASSPQTPLDLARRQPAMTIGDKEPGGRERQGQSSKGEASGRHRLLQHKKPAVVREVKLAPPVNSATAVAAALLLTDGRVWWVADLQAGTWEKVTVSSGGAGATAEGVAREGCLSSSGASAITVVRLPENSHAESRKTGRSDREETFVAGADGGGDCGNGSGRGVAIVVGRDDGWLFLLTQRGPTSTEVEDARAESAGCRRRGEQQPQAASSQPRPWRIGAAWKGHRSRVTAIWAIGDASQSDRPMSSSLQAPAGGSRGFTAALDTSRLCVSTRRGERASGEFCGSLVSAGGDGTVAWWEWACAEQDGGVLHGDALNLPFGEVATRAPRLRMVRRMCVVVLRTPQVSQFRLDIACGTMSCCITVCGVLLVPVFRFEHGPSGRRREAGVAITGSGSGCCLLPFRTLSLSSKHPTLPR